VPWNGVYIPHERSEGSDPMWFWPSQDPGRAATLIDAVMETIEVGERSGATVVASHIKAKGAHYWGSGAAAIRLIEQARARGVQIYADQYPYDTSGSDGSTVLIPGRIRDTATFVEPHHYAEGNDPVLIAGQPVVENGTPTGRPTGARPGKVLAPAAKPRA
jgi:N-acyl-D-amino-acid deacylase